MSDEAAFLNALRANPADDTVRLVYADWLDEHGEPAKAEYLRLVVALARAETDYARDQPDVARTLALAETLPADWRAAAGNRFMLVFYGCFDPAKKTALIRVVRSATGFGQIESERIVDAAPIELLTNVPFEQVFVSGGTVNATGGAIRIQRIESDINSATIRYTLVARGWHYPSQGPLHPLDKEELAPDLQSLLTISTPLVIKLLAEESVVLAEGLEFSVGVNRKREVEDLLRKFFAAPAQRGRLWRIAISLIPAVVE